MIHQPRLRKHKNILKYAKRLIVELKRLQKLGNRLLLKCVLRCFRAFHYPNFSLLFWMNVLWVSVLWMYILWIFFSGWMFVVKHHPAISMFRSFLFQLARDCWSNKTYSENKFFIFLQLCVCSLVFDFISCNFTRQNGVRGIRIRKKKNICEKNKDLWEEKFET